MRIGILGTGNLATALATGWARAGHDIIIGGRSTAAAEAIANRIGGTARPVPTVAAGTDAVLLAVHWDGVTAM
ncbi:NAD(P)-binding domain-containing protein, partial [Micromonospora sp. D75]|uniref:NAD(P)-binding domain-containing protein n=1 Tax=Micromonospora sp. D75 TaxID=2824885 RepID=UPI001B38850A